MTETFALWGLAIMVALFLVGWCILFAIIWRSLARVFAVLALWNATRRFFKSIERFRRDFR